MIPTVPLGFIDDLKAVGVDIEDPWDLVNTSSSYPAAIPVLVEWLDRDPSTLEIERPNRFQEALVRALTVKEARGIAFPSLLREFRRSDVTPGYRWAVGNALGALADDESLPVLESYVRDPAYGTARQMIVSGFGRLKSDRVNEILLELLDDKDVVAHAVGALGKRRAEEAREPIQALTNDPRPLVRREAIKALKKIG